MMTEFQTNWSHVSNSNYFEDFIEKCIDSDTCTCMCETSVHVIILSNNNYKLENI